MSARNQPNLKIGLVSLLTASALLAGCAVGPDYARPASTLPEDYDQPIEARAAARREKGEKIELMK